MPTPAEKKALVFVATVAVLGASVRVLRAVGSLERAPVEARAALDRQLDAVDSARASRRRGRGEGRTAGTGARGRAGRKSDTTGPGTPADHAWRNEGNAAAGPRPPIDLDLASVDEIEALPGIGKVIAGRIATDRAERGPFGSLSNLQRVKGVGPALSQRIGPLVTFSGTPRPLSATEADSSAGAPKSSRRRAHVRPARDPPACCPTFDTRPSPFSDPVMAAPVVAIERIGDLLVREGMISREQLARALEEQRSSGGNTRVGYTLVKLGFIQENELTKMLARQYKMPAIDLARFEVDPKIAKMIPSELATKNLVIPLKRDGRTLTIAMADPTNLGVLDDLKFITRYDIFPVIAGEFTLRNVIEKIYGSADEQQLQTLMSSMEEDGDVEVVEEEQEVDAATLAAQVEDAPVVKLLNAILTDAVKRGASDIHFECFEHELRVRYRIDGALSEVMKPPMKLKAALISRFKIMASLNIAERRVPQDGRIKLKVGSKVIDYRVSTLPTLFGEKIVLRILDKGNLTLDLEKFGIEARAERDLMEAVMNPYGMVLVTGPTGSGKTTTLYSALAKVNNIDVNIMTAEDPVEYNMYGVNQVLVRNEVGMTFAAALKAFLRQDPNIIMVGEIRDLETGGIAIKAALTGHLVLSTLHTNSAPETVTRLLDMGLEPFNVASALNLVLAQRLLRRICGSCKVAYQPTDEELNGAKVTRETTLRELRFTEEAIESAKARASKEASPYLADVTLDTPIGAMTFFKGTGCDTCAGTGLKGRQGVYEVMPMTPKLRRLIIMNSGAAEIRDGAIDEGMLTLRMDAWMKVMKGITTMEQMIRETAA